MSSSYLEVRFPSSGLGKHKVKAKAREAFVDWLATPVEQRDPPSMAAFARLHGVGITTVKGWKTDARFQLAANERLSQRVDFDDVPQVIAALAKVAKDPENYRSVQAAGKLLEYLKWSLPVEAQGSIDVKNMSDEDLRLAMLAAVDEMDTREHRASGSHHKKD